MLVHLIRYTKCCLAAKIYSERKPAANTGCKLLIQPNNGFSMQRLNSLHLFVRLLINYDHLHFYLVFFKIGAVGKSLKFKMGAIFSLLINLKIYMTTPLCRYFFLLPIWRAWVFDMTKIRLCDRRLLLKSFTQMYTAVGVTIKSSIFCFMASWLWTLLLSCDFKTNNSTEAHFFYLTEVSWC